MLPQIADRSRKSDGAFPCSPGLSDREGGRCVKFWLMGDSLDGGSRWKPQIPCRTPRNVPLRGICKGLFFKETFFSTKDPASSVMATPKPRIPSSKEAFVWKQRSSVRRKEEAASEAVSYRVLHKFYRSSTGLVVRVC